MTSVNLAQVQAALAVVLADVQDGGVLTWILIVLGVLGIIALLIWIIGWRR